MTELPTGTMTFLFTDIEGSTRLWEQHPEAMQAALARHDVLLRQAIESHGGPVLFCLSPPSARPGQRVGRYRRSQRSAAPWRKAVRSDRQASSHLSPDLSSLLPTLQFRAHPPQSRHEAAC
jgi:hypothetical protein